MRTRVRLLAACLGLLSVLLAPASARALPAGFFGIDPQTGLTDTDTQYMAAGGIGSVRIRISWAGVQPEEGGYDWSSVDALVVPIARARRTLPTLFGTPSWLEGKETTLPVGDRLRGPARPKSEAMPAARLL